jgi:hypothetical protein
LTAQIKPFTEAIGEMCIEWAHLEGLVNRLFLSIGGWDYRLPTALVMSGCLDFRDQIKAAEIGAITRCPHGEFLNNTIACLDYIDNELRVTRNRFVHDIWAPADDALGAMKIDTTPKVKRTPSTGIRTIQQWENKYVSIEEVREVIADIINERNHLGEILQCFQNPEDVELPSRIVPPPRLHRVRQQDR